MTNTCLQCKRPTSNPRFCDRSCAAKFNNRIHPKRKPEGRCTACGAVVESRQKLCPSCRAKREEALKRERRGIRFVHLFDGTVIEVEAPRVYVSSRLVFEIAGYGSASRRPYGPAEPSGTLLDLLLALVLSDAPYIHDAARSRHAAMLVDLKGFEVPRSEWSRRASGRVAAMPLSDLPWAISRWVQHHGRSNIHPLMQSFAIATAELVRAHAFGESLFDHDARSDARLPRLVSAALEEDRWSRAGFGFLDESRFKREVTERVGGLIVLACVPEGARFVDPRGGATVLESGVTFAFRISRCHLSTGFYDRDDLVVEDVTRLEYDIDDGFRFRGHFIGRLPPGFDYTTQKLHPNDLSSEARLLELEIPARWIVAALVLEDWRQPYVVRPLPT